MHIYNNKGCGIAMLLFEYVDFSWLKISLEVKYYLNKLSIKYQISIESKVTKYQRIRITV